MIPGAFEMDKLGVARHIQLRQWISVGIPAAILFLDFRTCGKTLQIWILAEVKACDAITGNPQTYQLRVVRYIQRRQIIETAAKESQLRVFCHVQLSQII